MTTTPLTDQQLAAIRAQLGDVKPATDGLIVSLAESVQDRRTHDHPTGNEDWFCNNLSGWAGDRTAAVLRRLLDAEAELGRVRAELTRRRTDDLTIRGALAPADGPRHVPMALGDSVTPAVEWLIADRNRLTVELEQARQQTEAVPCADCGHVEAAHSENGDRDCTASGARVTSCSCSYFIPSA